MPLVKRRDQAGFKCASVRETEPNSLSNAFLRGNWSDNEKHSPEVLSSTAVPSASIKNGPTVYLLIWLFTATDSSYLPAPADTLHFAYRHRTSVSTEGTNGWPRSMRVCVCEDEKGTDAGVLRIFRNGQTLA